MCTSPILIRNKKFSRLIHPYYGNFVSVPCGVCDECLSKRANDIYVRTRIEYLECVKAGGIGFMCTLTYDNINVPRLSHLGNEYMVFNKKHVIDYIKRLRVNLDRFYRKNYDSDAPDFKYLITSEFGSNPYATHRPHYHAIFLFNKFISYYVFKLCFVDSLSVSGRNVFGKIYQCDVIDPKKGGIKYSCKYILKDNTYNNQNQIIINYIKFYKDYVNAKHGIKFFPEDEEDRFRNKCIRSTKAYKKDVSDLVLPYRHMLQFYLCSNDLGVSALIQRFGASLLRLSSVNFEGFEYCVPRLVKKRIAETQGDKASDKLAKSVFMKYVISAFNDLLLNGKICSQEAADLVAFAESYLIPRFGYIGFVHSFDPIFGLNDFGLHDWDDFINESLFFSDNDFYDLRRRFIEYLNLYCRLNKDFREKRAFEKLKKQREQYIVKKRNKSFAA